MSFRFIISFVIFIFISKFVNLIMSSSIVLSFGI